MAELKLLAAETERLMTAERRASEDGLDLKDIVPLWANSALDLLAEMSSKVWKGTARSNISLGSSESSVSEMSPPDNRWTISSGMIWKFIMI